MAPEQSDRDKTKEGREEMTNIFVGNLSFQTTQDELASAFASYGTVERVNIEPVVTLARRVASRLSR